MSLAKIILVPTDFSAAAGAALDQAVALAGKLGGRVYVMHAYQFPVVGFPAGAMVPTAEIATQIVESAESELGACVAKRKASGVEIIPILKQADPRDAVLTVAEEIAADLVIMGTHGRRGLARALIGSVAEAVVRTSSVPVMTLRAPVSSAR
jgi:nucleotide-binding universal stress UspA family protein